MCAHVCSHQSAWKGCAALWSQVPMMSLGQGSLSIYQAGYKVCLLSGRPLPVRQSLTRPVYCLGLKTTHQLIADSQRSLTPDSFSSQSSRPSAFCISTDCCHSLRHPTVFFLCFFYLTAGSEGHGCVGCASAYEEHFVT